MRFRPARSTHAHPGAPDSMTGETDSAASSSAECAELSAAGERWTTIRSEEIARACAIVIPGRIPSSRARIETASSSACGARLFPIASTLSASAGFERTRAAIEKSATMMHAIRAIGHRLAACGNSNRRFFAVELWIRLEWIWNWIDERAYANMPPGPAHLVPRDHPVDG